MKKKKETMIVSNLKIMVEFFSVRCVIFFFPPYILLTFFKHMKGLVVF